jgi:hypothetical protein
MIGSEGTGKVAIFAETKSVSGKIQYYLSYRYFREMIEYLEEKSKLLTTVRANVLEHLKT